VTDVSSRTGFARRLVAWQRTHGRHDLPWQGSRDPYRIWVSEIMLQQTQVSSVIPYFQRFMSRFPDVAVLAAADEDDVLGHWSGLGYYARARNLHRAARLIADVHGGAFPREAARIAELPGVGRSTAAAVAAFAFGERGAILDGNVKRVLARWLGVRGWPGDPSVQASLWREAENLLPPTDIEAYSQGLMDLGSQVCTRSKPACDACPVKADCRALRDGLTGVLPEPRPRKPLPQRETGLLILARAGEVMLEKRPPTGIWGGLWSFPELTLDEDPSTASDLRYGARIDTPRPLPAVEHGFTHFRLTLRPWHAQVVALSLRANEPGLVWLSLADAAAAAVPAPIRKLLLALQADT
jgi:A/G-specific adenine glycosylase